MAYRHQIDMLKYLTVVNYFFIRYMCVNKKARCMTQRAEIPGKGYLISPC